MGSKPMTIQQLPFQAWRKSFRTGHCRSNHRPIPSTDAPRPGGSASRRPRPYTDCRDRSGELPSGGDAGTGPCQGRPAPAAYADGSPWPSPPPGGSRRRPPPSDTKTRTGGQVGVGSRAGAPTVGSGGDTTAFAMGLSPAPVVTFPPPATSNPACRLPAPGFPVDFLSRVMGPMVPERLSARGSQPDTRRRARVLCRATAYSTSSSQTPDLCARASDGA